MKPRRWYSSTELNPHPTAPNVRLTLARIHLDYASRAGREQGPIIKQQIAPQPATLRRPVEQRILQWIEAA